MNVLICLELHDVIVEYIQKYIYTIYAAEECLKHETICTPIKWKNNFLKSGLIYCRLPQGMEHHVHIVRF